jgi:hypothetical protein
MINVYFQSRHAVFSYQKKFQQSGMGLRPTHELCNVGGAGLRARHQPGQVVRKTLQKLVAQPFQAVQD